MVGISAKISKMVIENLNFLKHLDFIALFQKLFAFPQSHHQNSRVVPH